MELELGLALPNYQKRTTISSSAADDPAAMIVMKGLDLNISTYDNHGSVVVNNKNKRICHHHHHHHHHHDIDYDDENEAHSKDLSFLHLWTTTRSHDQDHDHPNILHINHKNNKNIDEEILVGWPPIKELPHRNDNNNNSKSSSSSMYVKVKMEGVPIGRKIDLSLYHSYQALTTTFFHMFSKYSENRNRDGEYTILYQDKQGHWMVAADVPWETFVESVQRMEIYNKYY